MNIFSPFPTSKPSMLARMWSLQTKAGLWSCHFHFNLRKIGIDWEVFMQISKFLGNYLAAVLMYVRLLAEGVLCSHLHQRVTGSDHRARDVISAQQWIRILTRQEGTWSHSTKHYGSHGRVVQGAEYSAFAISLNPWRSCERSKLTLCCSHIVRTVCIYSTNRNRASWCASLIGTEGTACT